MRVVLDTNVLLPCFRRQSRFRWLFDHLLQARFGLVVSTPILLEYEEVIQDRTTPEVARNVLKTLLALPNLERVEPKFHWRLIVSDPDDDKFVDAYLAAGADAIVTHDAHFDGLAAIEFPSVRVVTADEFQDALLARS